MNIGELNRRISLYGKDRVPDGMGGYETRDNVLKAKVWAKFLRPKFWTATAADGVASGITQGIVIRTRDIGPNWTVNYKGQVYKILHIDYSDRETITLTCQMVVHNG
jgi:head-tail adaptor